MQYNKTYTVLYLPVFLHAIFYNLHTVLVYISYNIYMYNINQSIILILTIGTCMIYLYNILLYDIFPDRLNKIGINYA